jgi:hypothetical protein
MAPLLKELSSLEVEPLEIVHDKFIQDRSLEMETLIGMEGEVNPIVILIGEGNSPTNRSCCCCHCACCCGGGPKGDINCGCG